MILKLQRSGFTETNLLFINFLQKCKNNNNEHLDWWFNIDINRMYSKAGFYDKKIEGTYFNINCKQARNSEMFQRWLDEYSTSLKSSTYTEFMTHFNHNGKQWKELQTYKNELKEFRELFNTCIPKELTQYWKVPEKIYKFLENKNVLIVNSFGALIVQQYENGNTHKIYPTFPILNNINYVHTPYTFFNNGPHNNFFETLQDLFEQIQRVEFDIALVSCGPYGAILVDRICKLLQKDAITMGSGITPMFGVMPGNKEPFWLSTIPPEFIPEGYEKIEKGRYWLGNF